MISDPPGTWFVDSEWGYQSGRIGQLSAHEPVVMCFRGPGGQRPAFRGRDPDLAEFIAEHRDDVFVAHMATAEMGYLLRQGIEIPPRWWDTFVAYRRYSNKPQPPRAGLSYALAQMGLPHLAPAEKDELHARILRLRFDPDSAEAMRELEGYCLSDCDGTYELYRRLVDHVNPNSMNHWAEYLKAVARMELRGIPIDCEIARMIWRSRRHIKADLIAEINKTARLYRRDGSFSRRAFLAWCRRAGIAWPVTRSKITGKWARSLDDDTMKLMEPRHPFIAMVRANRKSIDQLGRSPFTIDGVTGRHYFSTAPFRSVTARNQPRQFIYGSAKWFRHLAVPPSPDHVLVYADFKSQEFGLAAALSGDEAMWASYATGDAHIDFAIRAGAAPPGATKDTHKEVRDKHKTVNLGLLYGQTAWGIAARLGISPSEAQKLVVQHRRIYAKYWEWSDRVVQHAYDSGEINTPCGWGSRVPFGSNERTWRNFPVQSSGADIMRLTAIYLDRQGCELLSIVHDGFHLSCPQSESRRLFKAIHTACEMATEHVIPGYRLGVDVAWHKGGIGNRIGRPLNAGRKCSRPYGGDTPVPSTIDPRVLHAVAQLDLKRPSSWRVLMVIVGAAEGAVADLEIADLARIAALSERTVKHALADLIRRGIVVRRARYGRLAVPLLGHPHADEPGPLFTARQRSAMKRALRIAGELLAPIPWT